MEAREARRVRCRSGGRETGRAQEKEEAAVARVRLLSIGADLDIDLREDAVPAGRTAAVLDVLDEGWTDPGFRRYQLRVTLPDRPGSLGAVAAALGLIGADVISVTVIERDTFDAVDDIVFDMPGCG